MAKNNQQTLIVSPLDHWEDFSKAKKAEGLTDYTLRKYREELGMFQRYLNETGKSTSQKTVQEFLGSLRDKGLSPSRIRNYWVSLKSLYTWAESNGRIDVNHNPMKGVKGPKLNKTVIEVYSDFEMRRILEVTPSLVYRTLFVVFWKTGVREAELLRVKRDDIDMTRKTIFIYGKGAKERIVPFDSECQQLLYEHLRREERPYVFGVRPAELRRVLKECCISAGISVRDRCIHCFRHTFACNYLTAGGNPLDLMYILGHSSLAMVNHYSQWVASSRAIQAYHELLQTNNADDTMSSVEAFVNDLPELDGLESKAHESTTPQNEQETANSFMEMFWDALGDENAPMLRETELWGEICRDKPEIELTTEMQHALRSWAYTMITFSGVMDRMTDVIERAVHLGYWYAKQEGVNSMNKERVS